VVALVALAVVVALVVLVGGGGAPTHGVPNRWKRRMTIRRLSNH
jgi:hypothetical protein